MRILNDFVCSLGHVTEHLTDHTQKTVVCSVCGNEAQRMLAAPRSKLEGITGSFPGAADRWAKVHEQAAKVEQSKSYYEG
jgi:hypothetical protein